MESIKKILETVVTNINQDPQKRKKIKEWINGYRGKIIGLKTENEAYHLVFDHDIVTLRTGDYSSCEFCYIGPSEVLMKIIQGKESAMRCGMSGAIKGWGSVNEAQKFEKLLI